MPKKQPKLVLSPICVHCTQQRWPKIFAGKSSFSSFLHVWSWLAFAWAHFPDDLGPQLALNHWGSPQLIQLIPKDSFSTYIEFATIFTLWLWGSWCLFEINLGSESKRMDCWDCHRSRHPNFTLSDDLELSPLFYWSWNRYYLFLCQLTSSPMAMGGWVAA